MAYSTDKMIHIVVGSMSNFEELLLQKVEKLWDIYNFEIRESKDQITPSCDEESPEKLVVEKEGMQEDKHFLNMDVGGDEMENKGQSGKMAISPKGVQTLLQDLDNLDNQAKKYFQSLLSQTETLVKRENQGCKTVLVLQLHTMLKQRLIFFLQKLMVGKNDWKSFKKKN